MSTRDDDLETRMSLLEPEVARLRERVTLSGADAAAARVLASGADHDVSEVRAELRAHTQALNALRETQLEQGDQITALQAELQAEMREGQAEMREGFATVHTGVAQTSALLKGIADSGQDRAL